MKLLVRIDGREAVLERNRGGTWRLDGKAFDCDCVEIAPGRYTILLDGRSFDVAVETESNGVCSAAAGGRTYSVELRDPRRYRPGGGGGGADGRQTLASPMPGKIVKVLVQAGQQVEAGQGLVVVEAMKMQNEVKAPRNGVAVAVHVSEGDSVGAGAPLVVVE
jgi:biotin carboxyl carrier protein